MNVKALAVIAAVLGLAMSVAAQVAAASDTVTVRREVLSVRLVAGGLAVRNTVTFSGSIASPVRMPLLPGARHLQGTGFSSAGTAWVVAAAGVGSVTLHYRTALPNQGLSAAWWLPGPTRAFLVDTGPGVSLPIELNQAFYPQGTSGSGTAAPVSIAHHLAGGSMRLNFEFTPPAPPVFYYGYAELLAAVVIGVVLVWWWRRPGATKRSLRSDGPAKGREN